MRGIRHEPLFLINPISNKVYLFAGLFVGEGKFEMHPYSRLS